MGGMCSRQNVALSLGRQPEGNRPCAVPRIQLKCIMEGGDCSNSAEDWVQWQAFVSIQYDECIEYATVSLSICVLPCGISQPVRRLPVICFCINSAALFTLYVFVSTELVKHKANVYNVQDHSNDTSTLTKVLMCHGKQEVDNYWYKHSWSYAACYLHF